MPRRARQYTSAEAGSFGLDISGVGAVATGTIEQPLAFLTELIALLGAGLLVGAAQSWLRLRRGVCPRCGFRHRGYPSGPLIHPAPSAAAAGLRRTAYLMLLGLLPWATMKLVWGLGGDALGMTAEEWRRSTETSQSSELTKFFESFGIDLTVLAGLVGGVLVLALVQRWAWRIPRWLLLLPAWIGGISLPVYGISLLMLGCLTLAGVVPEPTDTGDFTANSLTWITLFGGASFGGLGYRNGTRGLVLPTTQPTGLPMTPSGRTRSRCAVTVILISHDGTAPRFCSTLLRRRLRGHLARTSTRHRSRRRTACNPERVLPGGRVR